MKHRTLFVLTLLLGGIALSGCPGGNNDAETTVTPTLRPTRDAKATGAFVDTDPWLLTTTDANAARGNQGIYLSNGTIGATFGNRGFGDKEGVVYRTGLYDEKEALRPIPAGHIAAIAAPKPDEPYRQTLDIRRGVLSTEYDRSTVTAFVSAARPDIVVIHVKGIPKNEIMSGATDRLGKSEAIFGAKGVPTRYVCADYAYGADPDATDSFTAVYALSEAVTEQGAKKAAATAAQTALASGFEALLTEHTLAWESRWAESGITIDGDPEAQQLVNKLMFDLLQSVRVGGDDSVAPEALSGNFYKGHIFWDADIWMFPALLAQYPDAAKNLLDYRYKHLPEARAIAEAQGFAGADYPWESASSGRETAPSGFSTERHVTAGVGFAAWQYFLATGDTAWLKERGYPVLSGVADHFSSRAKKNVASGKYEIKGVFGPDENKGKVDNNTYTNALAKYCLEAAGKASKIVGKPVDPKWAEVAKNIALPFDKEKGAYLTRDADELKSTKQADGELVIYPARLPMPKATAEKTFDLHAPRPIKTGPAMTASMHALIAARLGRDEEAERYFRESYRPFVRGPFALFSEKRTLDRCVFTTGAGGILQSVIYGFGGVDFDDWDAMAKAPVALPPTWKSLTIRGVQHQGKRYTVTVTKDGRTVTAE
ncbi:MAG: glycoside hydrolase family 65 protein [Fibrella sp.]|nr:glycoside hydrolase family 65 protein [Armatimonadota bacterium]